LIVVIVVILFYTYGREDFVIDRKDISSITIRYKTKLITLEDDNKVQEFINNITKVEYNFKSSAMGHKGWMYNVSCYSDSKLLYNFYIVSQDTIVYHNNFYTTGSDNLNMDYFIKLLSYLSEVRVVKSEKISFKI
jgi:hypothetical protein